MALPTHASNINMNRGSTGKSNGAFTSEWAVPFTLAFTSTTPTHMNIAITANSNSAAHSRQHRGLTWACAAETSPIYFGNLAGN